jgi:hypothetical protein
MTGNRYEGEYFMYNGEECGSGAVPRGVTCVKVHPSVKAIKEAAFMQCLHLTTVDLGDELEEIVGFAFQNCMSLREILIPPAVKAIGECAFRYCPQLRAVNFREGLEEIGKEAFHECTSLQLIEIPPVAKSSKRSQ